MGIPVSLDIPMSRLPIANWAFALICVAASGTVFIKHGFFDGPSGTDYAPFIFEYDQGLLSSGILLSAFGHGDVVHLLFNLIGLILFGSAVNAKLGHMMYIGLFFLGHIAAVFAWYVISGTPGSFGLGASGAIMTMIGACVVLYPLNDVTFEDDDEHNDKYFHVPLIAVAGMYVAIDLFGLVHGDGPVGNAAHLGGFAAGFAIIGFLVYNRHFPPTRYEQNLWQVLGLLPYNPEPMPKDYAHLWDPYAQHPQEPPVHSPPPRDQSTRL